MTVFVNLFGPPSAGKSTTRAGVFYRLKMMGLNVEETPEFAKDLTWEGRRTALHCQAYVFGEQLWRMQRLVGKVDAVITDSPLLLQAFYARRCNVPASFIQGIYDYSQSFENMDYFIRRVKPYQQAGRTMSEADSDKVGVALQSMLSDFGMSPTVLDGDQLAAGHIAMDVLHRLQDGQKQ